MNYDLKEVIDNNNYIYIHERTGKKYSVFKMIYKG